MQIFQGIAVSPGVAIGPALVIDTSGLRIARQFVSREHVEEEVERLHAAFRAVEREITINRDAVARDMGQQYGAIFAAHLEIVRDPNMRQEVENLVRHRHYSAEFATSRTLRGYARKFEALENARMAERATDIVDIEKRLLRNLTGQKREEIAEISSRGIVLARTLTPSETANLDTSLVLGFVTETGGLGSHTAIVAEAQGIPAVVGAGEFLADMTGGEMVIVDGNTGRVILRPDEETLARYQRQSEEKRAREDQLRMLRDQPAQTACGTPLSIMANIEFPHEVQLCLDRGAGGIGLYRTEFLYLVSDAEPDEQQHYEAYARVVAAMEGRPVCIRTVDLGADKLRTGAASPEERNPFLGLRSVRLSLRYPAMFRTQLRAILRASSLGDVRVMFPLIATLDELRQVRAVLAGVMNDLRREGQTFNERIPVGIMVEVPATVMLLDRFVREIDFISIGTNDLIQYALAVDRSNKEVASLYNAADPAVLRLLELSIAAARRGEIDVSLCGQMSSNPLYTMLLLGLGLRSLSVPPHAILQIKTVCRSVTVAQCEAVAQAALAMESASEIGHYLAEELRKVAPEMGTAED